MSVMKFMRTYFILPEIDGTINPALLRVMSSFGSESDAMTVTEDELLSALLSCVISACVDLHKLQLALVIKLSVQLHRHLLGCY